MGKLEKVKEFIEDVYDDVSYKLSEHFYSIIVCIILGILICSILYISHKSAVEHQEMCSMYCERIGCDIYTIGGEFNNSNYCCCYDDKGIKEIGIDSKSQLVQLLNINKTLTNNDRYIGFIHFLLLSLLCSFFTIVITDNDWFQLSFGICAVFSIIGLIILTVRILTEWFT